jgi:hypothetical protein
MLDNSGILEVTDPIQITHRMFKKAFQQGHSEVRDAKNNEAHGAMKKERHVCARRRVGEPAVF